MSTGACRPPLRNVGTNASNPFLVDENGQFVGSRFSHLLAQLAVDRNPCRPRVLVRLWAGPPSAIVSSRPHARAAREAALAGPYAAVICQQDCELAEDSAAHARGRTVAPAGAAAPPIRRAGAPPLQNKKMVVPRPGMRVPRVKPLTDTNLYLMDSRPPDFKTGHAHLQCSICLNVKSHAVTNNCGHSHCYVCIRKCLEFSWQCPSCRNYLVTAPILNFDVGAAIAFDHPTWVDESVVSYTWEGLIFAGDLQFVLRQTRSGLLSNFGRIFRGVLALISCNLVLREQDESEVSDPNFYPNFGVLRGAGFRNSIGFLPPIPQILDTSMTRGKPRLDAETKANNRKESLQRYASKNREHLRESAQARMRVKLDYGLDRQKLWSQRGGPRNIESKRAPVAPPIVKGIARKFARRTPYAVRLLRAYLKENGGEALDEKLQRSVMNKSQKRHEGHPPEPRPTAWIEQRRNPWLEQRHLHFLNRHERLTDNQRRCRALRAMGFEEDNGDDSDTDIPEGMCGCDRTECQETHRNETAKRRERKSFEARYPTDVIARM
ncbi:hypothetical protein B0H16DRAFT_1481456 [Mycena metata]|uniref:RING-type domain-containing protein n=1 Tax=Mycena metata TaxID=1033252 RepID=A0AAD7MAJ4_9AGAR|nr:hypothetical protein B0H16DRAFT_1481456 [Mycena metata]